MPVNSSLVYYRIQTFDNEGKYQFSNIVSFKLQAQPLFVSLYPNPFVGPKISLSIRNNKTEKLKIVFVDILGRIILEQNIMTTNGINHINLDIFKDVAKGLYHLKLHRFSDNSLVFESSLIKEEK